MLNIIGKIIGAFIQSITTLIFMKKILDNNVIKLDIKNIVTSILLAILILIIHTVDYNAINPMLFFIVLVHTLYLIYKIKLSKSFLCSSFFMLTLFLVDIIVSVIFVSFTNAEELRGNGMILILANLLTGLIIYFIINNNKIRKKYNEIINMFEKIEKIELFCFIILIICSLSFIFYMISENYFVSKIFLIDVMGILIFLLLAFIFFKEKYEKEIIINNYDQLFEYSKNFENWIDNDNINMHESKNQLATLREMVLENQEAVEYIDNIINENINNNKNNIKLLKNIPKGGLKGLLFYKITVAENNKIDLFIDISKKVYDILSNLNVSEIKTLCRLIGIYFDNAIEAAVESKLKRICCEFYCINEEINIVISNTFSDKIDLIKIKEKGYSTKGQGRGNGLYLANNICNREDMFKLENRIINNYYVQKIIIKKNTNFN